ncbi:sensor histidine kinase [Leucobacter komagatae]|uniref:sensor histidine kinase n=1 Tax=Leucobacter komagatae TaxID=55969 RepID=UPI00069728E7|nr:sensor histidine kinase [Leucobacter komagatae]
MDTQTPTTASVVRETGGLYSPAMVGRDLGYILPGFPIAIVSFSLLLTLATASISTLILWVGLPLLAVTLVLATTFAELSRARLRWWDGDGATPRYLPKGTGAFGMLRALRDPRRWFDLAFEMLVAFPLRIFTFVFTLTWLSMAIGGITWVLWGYFLPREDNTFPANLLLAISDGAIPETVAHSYWVEAIFYTLFGVVAIASLPPVLRGLAVLDATVARLALCPDATSSPSESPAQPTAITARAGWPKPRRFGADGGWVWILAGYSAVVLVAIGWPLLANLYSVHVAIAMVLVIAQAAALLLAIRLPAVAIAVAAAAPAVATLISSLDPGVPWPWPVSMLITQAGIVLIIALRRGWQWVLAAWCLPQAAVIAAVLISQPGASGFTSASVTNMVVTSSVTLGIALLGIVIQAFAEDRGELVKERRANAELDAKQKELAERNLIARELHDVVAHSMSVVSIQANTAKYRIPGLGDAAEAEFAAIAESSRQALTEMRSLLATLRAPDGSAPLVPQPTLADLPALIEASRQSGATITYAHDGLDELGAGENTTVPASTALTTYRVAQEALANAMRHSPGAEINVTVAASSAGLSVSVVNGPASTPPGASAGSGMGIAGISERVSALGGSIDAGPTDDGGFAVRAVLPL